MSRFCNTSLFLLLTLLFAISSPASAQYPKVVQRIEITSTWSETWPRRIHPGTGLGDEPRKTDLVIRRDGGAFRFEGEDKIVDASLIRTLVKALTEPANAEANLDDLGITPAWLKANASAVVGHFSGYRINGGPIPAAMLESAFADPATIDRFLPGLFDRHSYICADCSRPILLVNVSVIFDDFSSLQARSSSQFPYMLPWRVSGKDAEVTAFNADISRAIVAFMPEKSTNRDRLSGENLAVALAKAALPQVERQAQVLEIESKTGGTLGVLRSRYTVESANIGNYADPALRGPHDGNPNLHLQLKASDWPSNFSDDVALAYVNGIVVGTDKFLKDGRRFEDLALSVPWLSEYAKSHPRVPIKLSFVHNASFSDAALLRFSADMKAIGREKIIPRVEAMKDRVALLQVGYGMGESDWLVFPDQRMIFWRFWRVPVSGGESDLPAWSASEYSAKPCGEPANFVHCVGREVSPNGSLQPE